MINREKLAANYNHFKALCKGKITFSLIQKGIFILSCAFLLYLVVSPFFPMATIYLKLAFDKTAGYHYLGQAAFQNVPSEKIKDLKPIPKENTLVIPKIGVDAQIVEGTDEKTLEKGIWHRPNTSTPDIGGNVVLAGHRYLYTSGPKTFYSLDKLKEKDKIIIFWKEKEYMYEVFETKVVPPTAVEIEDAAEEPTLTLFTCTPLFTQTNRLVVKAKLASS